MLIPKQIKNHALKKNELRFSSTIINQIIRNYTREAGVRNLEKEIAKVCRKSVKIIETSKKKNISLDKTKLQNFLGVSKFRSNEIEKKNSTQIQRRQFKIWDLMYHQKYRKWLERNSQRPKDTY